MAWGCVAALAFLAARPADRIEKYAPLEAVGQPVSYRTMPGGWLLSYNGMTRAPRCTVERIDARTKAGDRAGVPFWSDPDVPDEFRVRVADYNATGYDRGHCAPNGDHGGSDEETHSTFTMANMMAQYPNVNRKKWKQLEEWLRSHAGLFGVREIFVVTAPAWLPQFSRGETHDYHFESFSPRRVWVPTHCLKTALIVHTDGSLEVTAWRLPNIEEPDVTLDECRISIDQFEIDVGLNVWPGIPDEETLESAVPHP